MNETCKNRFHASQQLKYILMKKLFVTLAIAAIGITSAFAQNTPKQKLTPEQKAETNTARLQKELALTADQKQKVYALELDKFKQTEEWHKKSHEDRKAQKEQHKALKDASDAKLDQVLTPDQKKKLDAIKTERKDNPKHKRGSKGKNKQTAPASSEEPVNGAN